MSRPDQKLIQKWYKKASESGFVDIERGKDLNQFPATTMPGKHFVNEWVDRSFAESDSADDGISSDQSGHMDLELNSLVNDSRAVFWRKARDKALAIKEPNEYKQFLLDWCESGNMEETAKDYGYTIDQARRIVKRFRDASGLVFTRYRSGSGPKRAERIRDLGQELGGTVSDGVPGVCRTLSRAEIETLNYQPPKRIKDKSHA